MTMNIKVTNTSDNSEVYKAAITVKEGKEVVDKIVLDPGETSEDILFGKVEL